MNTPANVFPMPQRSCPRVGLNSAVDRRYHSTLESSVLIVADTESQPFYRSITLDHVSFLICDCSQVLDILRKTPPEVSVVDCGEDVELGLALIRRLKCQEPSTPVIFITSVSSEEIIYEAFRTGVRDFLKRPINPAYLKESIAYLLEIRSTTTEKRLPLNLKRAANQASSLRVGPVIPPNLLDVVQYIEANLTKEITLDQLAKEASISKYHFCKVFKKHLALSPLKFVAYKRIELARELLKRSDFNVSLTAGEVGFQDLSNFSKQFRKITGLTPLSYRSFFTDIRR